MTLPKLTRVEFRGGVWRGQLTGSSVGMIEVLHEGQPLPEVDVAPDGEGWVLTVMIPSETLGEGVSTFLVRDRDSGAEIGGFEIAIGESDDDDLRAQVRLLRAELDLLKHAFRRHVTES